MKKIFLIKWFVYIVTLLHFSLQAAENNDNGWTIIQNKLDLLLKTISKSTATGCTNPRTDTYLMSLSLKGEYGKCTNYVEKCINQKKEISIRSLVQGAFCAKADSQYQKAYNFFEKGLTLKDFKNERADELIIQFVFFTSSTMFSEQTDLIINNHPSWSDEEKKSIKALVELYQGRHLSSSEEAKTKDFLLNQIEKNYKTNPQNNTFLETLALRHISLLERSGQYNEEMKYLIKYTPIINDPLALWSYGFDLAYKLSPDDKFENAKQLYNIFAPYANPKTSSLPVENNVYTYSELEQTVCSKNMLQGIEYENLMNQISNWRDGKLTLDDFSKNLKNLVKKLPNKSNLLSTYANILMLQNDRKNAQKYFWKSHLACIYNNRSHRGLQSLRSNDYYKTLPSFENENMSINEFSKNLVIPKETKFYIINWDALPKESQIRTLYGARIWIPFFKDLYKYGRVYIKQPFELLSNCPFQSHLRDERIEYEYDKRLWDDTRGTGGLTVIADHNEVFNTVHGDFNLLAHELSHQASYFFSENYPNIFKCIESLYDQAKTKKQFVDNYSSTNYKEYFAQGVVYYLIPESAPIYFGSNRGHLKATDENLYKFVNSINNSNGDLSLIKCPL